MTVTPSQPTPLYISTMSFLLRNSNRSGAGRIHQGSGSSSDTRIIPRPRPNLNRRRAHSNHLLQRRMTSAGQVESGNQILLQRTVQQKQKYQSVSYPSRTKEQVETMKQQQDVPGVISMSEGMSIHNSSFEKCTQH